jgi:hypothetical protein
MLQSSGHLTQMHPQAATKILLKCVAPAPGYLAQTCHPQVAKKSLTRFDKATWQMWLDILGGVGPEKDQLSQCVIGQFRSRQWAYLPARLGGAGLRWWAATANFAWFTSVAECTALQDPDFERGRAFLKIECEEAHKLALDALGGPTYVNQANYEFIPPEEPDVLYASDYYKDWLADYDWTKLQKEFSDFTAQKLLRAITPDGDDHMTNHSHPLQSGEPRDLSPDTTICSKPQRPRITTNEKRIHHCGKAIFCPAGP